MTSATKALRVITADNPSPLTGAGTNTFLLGRGRIAVLDPGPDLPAHRAALLEAAKGGRIELFGDGMDECEMALRSGVMAALCTIHTCRLLEKERA